MPARPAAVVVPTTGLLDDARSAAACGGAWGGASGGPVIFLLYDEVVECGVQLVLDCDRAAYTARAAELAARLAAEGLDRDYGVLEPADDPEGAFVGFRSDDVCCPLMPELLGRFEGLLRTLGLIAPERPRQVPPGA